jgi:aprataxin
LTASESDLESLRTLLRRAAAPDGSSSTRARAQAASTLRVLADAAARLRGEIEREMEARYGFVWDVWVGFHAVPSME